MKENKPTRVYLESSTRNKLQLLSTTHQYYYPEEDSTRKKQFIAGDTLEEIGSQLIKNLVEDQRNATGL